MLAFAVRHPQCITAAFDEIYFLRRRPIGGTSHSTGIARQPTEIDWPMVLVVSSKAGQRRSGGALRAPLSCLCPFQLTRSKVFPNFFAIKRPVDLVRCIWFGACGKCFGLLSKSQLFTLSNCDFDRQGWCARVGLVNSLILNGAHC